MKPNEKERMASRSGGVVVIGELNVDLVASGLETAPILGHEILAQDFQITLGSASAIFASGIRRLGHPVTFISKVGADDFGRYCKQALENLSISVDYVHLSRASTTGVTVSLSTNQDRALVTYLGAIAELKLEDVPLDILKGHRHLHMTSLFLQHALRPSFPTIFREARNMGLTTSFDPNSDPSQSWRPDIWDVISQTDILFVNEIEAQQLSREPDVEKALTWLGSKAPCVVIKRGSLGAMAIQSGKIAFKPGFPVRAIDTTGAGDSFAAGFVDAYMRGGDLPRCLQTGNACGAMSTLQVGGTTGQPNQAQLTNFLQEQGEASGATKVVLNSHGQEF
jgi:sugar/nucleoside kinase (ribokinase family)